MTSYEVQNRISAPFIWVDARIEEMKIDPYSYRLYMRLIYRARNSSKGCFESQENIAQATGISKRKIISCLQFLSSLKMIEINKRRNAGGHFSSNVIILTDPTEWVKRITEISPCAPHAHGQVHHMHTAKCTTCTPSEGAKTNINHSAAKKTSPHKNELTRSSIELDLNINLNAAEKQPAATIEKKSLKRTKPKTKKMKSWEEKSQDEKKDTLLNKACDSHRIACEQRKANPYPFESFKDFLIPILEDNSLEKIKEFFESLESKNKGCDVRKLSKEIKKWNEGNEEKTGGNNLERVMNFGSVMNLEGEKENFRSEGDTIVQNFQDQVETKQKSFPEKVIKQIERNAMNTNAKTQKLEVENFPIRFKEFYNCLKFYQKKQVQYEMLSMGLDTFFKKRAPAILKCKYEDLFCSTNSNSAYFDKSA